MRPVPIILVALVLLLASLPAHAFRCGNRIVAENMHEAEVRRLVFEGGVLVSIESLGYGYREK